MTDEKQKILVKMFLGYPSMASIDKTQMAGMLASYLETLSSISSEVLSAACDAFRRRGEQFPPSAGNLFAECERRKLAAEADARWAAAGSPKIDFARYRLPPPSKRGFTLAQLADWTMIINDATPYTMRVDANGKPLKVPPGYPGAGQEVEYGYLTPEEAEAVKSRRARIASMAKSYRDAAE